MRSATSTAEAGFVPRIPHLARPATVAWALAVGGLLLVAISAVLRVEGYGQVATPGPGNWVLALIGLPMGARLASHVPRNACAWLVLAVGLLSAVSLAGETADDAGLWLASWTWWPGYGLLVIAILLFPTGRVPSRPWLAVVAVLSVAVVVGSLALAAFSLRTPGGLLDAPIDTPAGWDTRTTFAATVVVVLGLVPALVSLVIRIRHSPRAVRGPLVTGAVAAVLLLASLVCDLFGLLPYSWLGAALALPVATTVAVVRYGLYDIDLLIHRSLLNALLTVSIIAVYAAAVEVASRVVPADAEAVAAAAAVVAVLPLRERLKGLVDRWLYGQRERPYELFTDLSRRIGVALTPDEVLASVVRTVGEGLKVPFAAVCLRDAPEPEASFGRRRDWAVTSLPLTHRGRTLGELVVQQRGPDEPWSRRERVLLADLAGQVGPSAAAVRLTRDLQAARERLVRAREEERRRLRHDLHDGVGPALSGARMQARACLSQPLDGPVRSALEALDGGLAEAAVEVRGIVDDLRPAALDRGVAAALEGVVRRHGTAPPVGLTVDGDLTGLPAAVEVAVYRLVDEALTNVVKHAHATAAHVTLTRDREAGRLELQVRDDGTGPGAPRDGGVGLESMAERCAELGGTFALRGGSPGTVLVATFPLR